MAKKKKAERHAKSVGSVFSSTVSDVMQMANTLDFTGSVDVGVEFRSVDVDSKGIIKVFVGNETNETSTQIKLATRVYLEGKTEASDAEGA